MTLDVHTLDQFLLVGSGVLLLAILAVRLSIGVGLPSLLVYLLMGVAMGEAGLGLTFDNAELAHALGFAALMLIMSSSMFGLFEMQAPQFISNRSGSQQI